MKIDRRSFLALLGMAPVMAKTEISSGWIEPPIDDAVAPAFDTVTRLFVRRGGIWREIGNLCSVSSEPVYDVIDFTPLGEMKSAQRTKGAESVGFEYFPTEDFSMTEVGGDGALLRYRVVAPGFSIEFDGYATEARLECGMSEPIRCSMKIKPTDDIEYTVKG